MTSQSKTSTHPLWSVPSRSAKHRVGRLVQWNLGGQELRTLDVVLADAEFVCVQEIARDAPGWDTVDGELFHWIVYRDVHMYRGVGIGISQDLLDSIIDKRASSRGIWILARVKGLGRVVFGSIHCHTGVTHSVYLQAVRDFFEVLPDAWKLHPLILGADVNERLRWSLEDSTGHLTHPSMNLAELVNCAHAKRICAVPPRDEDLDKPTHYPRDITREGRQIDSVWSRGIQITRGEIRPELRLCIGSDHAPLFVGIPLRPRKHKAWDHSSKARFVTRPVDEEEDIIEVDDLRRIALNFTKAKWNRKYCDNDEVVQLLQQAKASNDAKDWKVAQKARKKCYRQWRQDQLANIISGDWGEFRAYKSNLRRKKGWWGHLLREKSSAELTDDVRNHLQCKLVDDQLENWDEILDAQLRTIPVPSMWTPFTAIDLATQLAGMRAAAAVGPDLIGVDLLRHLAGHEKFGKQLLDLVNHIVYYNQRPDDWDDSFLALLAKVAQPSNPSDLRPICVSSAMGKLINRMTAERVLPALRRGSACSSCGKGRQVSDLLGAMSRLQEMAKEWGLPLLVAKLDVKGAFDRLNRQKVLDLFWERLDLTSLGVESRFLLTQLHTQRLRGEVPGGDEIEIRPNVGIKQGAPESAEIFGLIMDSVIAEMRDTAEWRSLPQPLVDLDLDTMFYQDDIFLIEVCPKQLAKRIQMVEKALGTASLSLSMKKTAVTATSFYKGPLHFFVGDEKIVINKDVGIKVLGLTFNFSSCLGDQAHELLGRARSALAEHAQLLKARGSWKSKLFTIQMLVASTFKWCAGAVHWSSECLAQANTLQLHTMRQAFGMPRHANECWVDWNTRTLRFLRAYMHRESVERWSTCILRLQFTLHGHWARRTEDLGRGIGDIHPNLAMRVNLWRNLKWWRHQQNLTNSGIRHPHQFYPSNTERQIASSVGLDWGRTALNRNEWLSFLPKYLHDWDVKWARGRQLTLRY